MKKNLSLILMVFTFVFTGCNKHQGGDTPPVSTTSETKPAEVKPAEVAPPPPATEEAQIHEGESASLSKTLCPDNKDCQCSETANEEEGSLVTKCVFTNGDLGQVYPKLYNYNEGFNSPESPKLLLAELPQVSKKVERSPESFTEYVIGEDTVEIKISLPGGPVRYLLKKEANQITVETYHELP